MSDIYSAGGNPRQGRHFDCRIFFRENALLPDYGFFFLIKYKLGNPNPQRGSYSSGILMLLNVNDNKMKYIPNKLFENYLYK